MDLLEQIRDRMPSVADVRAVSWTEHRPVAWSRDGFCTRPEPQEVYCSWDDFERVADDLPPAEYTCGIKILGSDWWMEFVQEFDPFCSDWTVQYMPDTPARYKAPTKEELCHQIDKGNH